MECQNDCLNCPFDDCRKTEKKYRSEESKERQRQANREWKKNHPEKVAEYNRKQSTKPEVIAYRRAYYKKYYQEHKEEYKIRAEHLRKRKKAAKNGDL